MKREIRVKCIKYKKKNTIMKKVLKKKKKKILYLKYRIFCTEKSYSKIAYR